MNIKPSPRSVALNAVVSSREELEGSRILDSTWAKIIDLAWETRSRVVDRRNHRREIVLLIKEGLPH
jgi:hypothetical protein